MQNFTCQARAGLFQPLVVCSPVACFVLFAASHHTCCILTPQNLCFVFPLSRRAFPLLTTLLRRTRCPTRVTTTSAPTQAQRSTSTTPQPSLPCRQRHR
jgi:hypothetical protein